MPKTRTYQFGNFTLTECPQRHHGHKEFMYESEGARRVLHLHENGEGFKNPVTGKRAKYYSASYSCDHGLSGFRVDSEPTDQEALNRRQTNRGHKALHPDSYENERPEDWGYYPSAEEAFAALKKNIDDRVNILLLPWK